MDPFTLKKRIGENLTAYLRLKGYTKTSLSKLTGISRPTLNQLFEGSSPNSTIFNQQLTKITNSLNLPTEYFINAPTDKVEKWQLPNVQFSDRISTAERSPLTQELLADLDELLTVAAFYIRE